MLTVLFEFVGLYRIIMLSHVLIYVSIGMLCFETQGVATIVHSFCLHIIRHIIRSGHATIVL